MLRATRWRGHFGGACLAFVACDGGDDDATEAPACAVPPASDCAPLYTPSFDEVYARTLVPGCATGGGSCHGSATASGGGFYIDDADSTFARLLQDRGEGSLVVAGDPSCSSLVVRLVIDDPVLGMPPGAPLAAGELCSVTRWIEEGATR